VRSGGSFRGNLAVDHLQVDALRTWHQSARPRNLSFDPALRWTRLAVLETRDGGLFDATGTVQFRATYVQHGKRGVLAETSKFVRQDRRWTYLGPID
jgi:SEC-C motif-containing protein